MNVGRNSMKQRIIAANETMSLRHWCTRALLFSLVAPLALLLGVELIGRGGLSLCVGTIIAMLFVGGVVVLVVSDCRHATRWWVASLAGAYVGLIICIAVFLALSPDVHVFSYHVHRVVSGSVLILLFAGMYTVTWHIIQMTLGPIVVQDGTLCPQCGYCLAGAESTVCSECGREFTFQELGTTKEEFEARKAQQVGAAHFSGDD